MARRLQEQRAAERTRRLARESKARAYDARAAFKPRKADRGKIIFVSVSGKPNPSRRGRKGYPIYVTRSGKKRLIRQHGEGPYKARTISELVLPDRPNLRSATKRFQQRRLVRVGRIHTIVKKAGSVKAGGAHDFSERISNNIASSIRSALTATKSHRTFLIKFSALVRLPNGQTQAIAGEVPIERPDHIAIRLAGIRNFVRQKFYGFMARELAFAGYVSNGSANHIRSLEANDGEKPEDWVDSRGEPWSGRDKTQVEIIRIDWTIEQAK